MNTAKTLKIVCPTCKSELVVESDTAHCVTCGATFQITNKIIDLMPENPHQEHVWGSMIEWKPFVQFYESRWWRRGLVNNLYLAISFDDELDMILKAANLKKGSTLLDLACGSGIYTRPFAQKIPQGVAVGLDLSMPMLEYASTKAQAEGIKNCIFIHGDAHGLPFADSQFDMVNCSGAIHLFPDLPKVLSEVYRVLNKGGRFTGGIGRWPWLGKWGRSFRDWYRQRAGVKGFFREELVSYFEKAGFCDIVFLYEKRAWFIMSAVKQ